MFLPIAVQLHGTRRRFDEGPFQVLIYLARGAAHPRAHQLPLIAERFGRNPALRRRAVAQQKAQAFAIQRVVFVRFAHALFGFRRIGQVR